MLETTKRRLISTGLKAISASRIHRILPDRQRGKGVIFMLHRVDPRTPAPHDFAPNRHLSVTPDFLGRVIELVRSLDMDIVSIDEAKGRLAAPKPRRFAVFTLDDGYRDNFDHAYPVFRAADAPFTIFVPSGWPSGQGRLWWQTLEDSVRVLPKIEINCRGSRMVFPSATVAEKRRAFVAIRNHLHELDPGEMTAAADRIASSAGVAPNAACARHIMTWDEIRDFGGDERVTFGAHSRTHAVLSKLDPGQLREELYESRLDLERVLGRPCRHMAYPYGNVAAAGPREYRAAGAAGFETAVTAVRGLVLDRHRSSLTALPRIPLEGDIQDTGVVDVQLSGAPFGWRLPFASGNPP